MSNNDVSINMLTRKRNVSWSPTSRQRTTDKERLPEREKESLPAMTALIGSPQSSALKSYKHKQY